MRSLGVGVFVGVLLLAGCAGGDDGANDSDATVESSTSIASVAASAQAGNEGVEELRANVQAYSDAFLTGDGEGAYALLSKRCQDRNGQEEFASMVVSAGELYGSALAFTSFDAQVSGDLARVSYTYDVASINQDAEPWVREGGIWHEDDC